MENNDISLSLHQKRDFLKFLKNLNLPSVNYDILQDCFRNLKGENLFFLKGVLFEQKLIYIFMFVFHLLRKFIGSLVNQKIKAYSKFVVLVKFTQVQQYSWKWNYWFDSFALFEHVSEIFQMVYSLLILGQYFIFHLTKRSNF